MTVVDKQFILNILSEGGDKLEAFKNDRYEDKIVNLLFSHYNLSGIIRGEMLRSAGEREGRAHLSLQAFSAYFPDFPIRLEAREIAKIVERSTVARCFNDFGKQPMMKEYVELYHEAEREVDTPFGLVFYWPRLKGPGLRKIDPETKKTSMIRLRHSGPNMIIHNAGLDTDAQGLKWFYRTPNGLELVIEPLTIFLSWINWQPTNA